MSARPRSIPWGGDPSSTARMSLARSGNPTRSSSRSRRTAVSTSSVSRRRSHVRTFVGRQPIAAATSRAPRSYQLSCRSIAPRSSSWVLISMMISVDEPGWKARMSIHPCHRPWTISTSLRVDQPCRARRRPTYAEHRPWSTPDGRGSITSGRAPTICRSRCSASPIRITMSSVALTRPVSIPAINDRDTPTAAASSACVMSSNVRASRQRLAKLTRSWFVTRRSQALRAYPAINRPALSQMTSKDSTSASPHAAAAR